MRFRNLSISTRLILSERIISLANQDPELGHLLARKGYPPEELAVGLALQEEAHRCVSKRYVAQEERLKATARVKALERTVRRFAVDDRNIARIALRGHKGLLAAVIRSRKIGRNRIDLVFQAQAFYAGVIRDPDVAHLLGFYGITVENARDRLATVQDLQAAMAVQKNKRGTAIVMTESQHKALRAHDDWMIEFIATARIAVKRDRGQLAKLGIV